MKISIAKFQKISLLKPGRKCLEANLNLFLYLVSASTEYSFLIFAKSCTTNGTQCTNTQGSYTCGHCDAGYIVGTDANGDTTCIDFDEVSLDQKMTKKLTKKPINLRNKFDKRLKCTNGGHDCDVNGGNCINFSGGFECDGCVDGRLI